jgi:hypothetical protein
MIPTNVALSQDVQEHGEHDGQTEQHNEGLE